MTGILYINPVAGTESPRNGDFLMSEAQGYRARDQVKLAVLNDSASSYLSGVVLGKQVIGSKGAFANAAGNTGNGTCGTITLSAGVQQGTYTFTCLVAGATGKFQGIAPNGAVLPALTVGSAFSGGGLAFTITTGGTNYAVADEFTITVGTAAFANGGSDTGNGTCSAIAVEPGVVGGTYTFTATSATSFTGVDPFGNMLPVLTVGTQYNGGGLQFTISAGGTAYVAGDTFTVTTYTGNDEYSPVSASAYDGTQNAMAILLLEQYVGGATALNVGVVSRASEVKADRLCWPSSITDDQQRNWINQLQSNGIIVRGDLV